MLSHDIGAKFYRIQAVTTTKTKFGEIVHQVPTFYLGVETLGIVNAEHACKIAKDMFIYPQVINISISAGSCVDEETPTDKWDYFSINEEI